MIISDKARRLGETILICCVVVILTGVWARGTTDTKVRAFDTAKKTEVVAIAKAAQAYNLDAGDYPEVSLGLPYCKPFNVYDGDLCLGELVGKYLEAEHISLTESDYVYMDRGSHVLIAANVTVSSNTSDNNRCDISGVEFWCVKLYR